MEFLKKKYGPLPAWAWIAILAVGVLAYMYWKNKQAAAATDTSNPTSPLDQGAQDYAAGLQAGEAVYPVQAYQPAPTTPGTTPGPTSAIQIPPGASHLLTEEITVARQAAARGDISGAEKLYLTASQLAAREGDKSLADELIGRFRQLQKSFPAAKPPGGNIVQRGGRLVDSRTGRGF